MLPIRFWAMAGILGAGLAACSSDEPPAGIQAYYNCGETPIAATYYDNKLDVQLDGKVLRFEQTIAAPDAIFYQQVDTPEETADIFWVQGFDATLIRGDDTVLVCRQVETSNVTSKGTYRAGGNEPGWMVLVADNRIELHTNYGEDKTVIEGVKATPSGKGIRFQAGDVMLNVTYELCQDDMSGLYYSDKVTLQTGGKTLKGCGNYLPAE